MLSTAPRITDRGWPLCIGAEAEHIKREKIMPNGFVYPIIYVRGFAGGTSGIDTAADDPFTDSTTAPPTCA
jgi:hypothetical protein